MHVPSPSAEKDRARTAARRWASPCCEAAGAFGFAWRCPQLESSVRWARGALLWTTPWGEEIP